MEEEEGRSEIEYTEIASSTDSLDNSMTFHVIDSILGFILYMHQQIPRVLQDMSMELENMKEEYKEMMAITSAKSEESIKGLVKRKHLSRMRDVRIGIKRFDKLMTSISGIQIALRFLISEIPRLDSFILILGASTMRPLQVYELSFQLGNSVLQGRSDFAKSKAAEALSRKAIRALIAKGAGSNSYPGPSKLFLLVKAPSSFNQPLHFLPKRDFRYSKKITPVKLRVKCKSQNLQMVAPEEGSSMSLADSPSNEFIWFQCRHVVKGLALTPSIEE